MKRILLTGAGGFLGGHVLNYILETTDWEVVAIDAYRGGGRIDRLPASDRVKLEVHDLRVPFSPSQIARIGDIDYAFNVASGSHVPRAIEDPRPFIENNVNLILTVLEWARQNPPQALLHVSSAEVYGPAPQDYDFLPGDRYRPSNPYSASKAMQDQACYSYWRTYDLPIGILATMNIIGEMQDPEKFVPMVTKKVLSGETVRVHADGGKPGSRYYIHARDIAGALVHLAHRTVIPRFSEGLPMAWHHVAGNEEVDNLTLAQLIAEHAEAELHCEMVQSDRPGHDSRYALDTTSLTDTGWKPSMTFEEGLARTVGWLKNHRDWLAG